MIFNAADALEAYRANAEKYKREEEIEKQKKEAAERERQKAIDDEWFNDAVLHCDLIIKHIIEDGPKYGLGLGRRNATNGYRAKGESGRICFNDYRFWTVVSGSAVRRLRQHYENQGYGCLVENAKTSGFGYGYNVEHGTVYIWIPTEEETLNAPNTSNEISW